MKTEPSVAAETVLPVFYTDDRKGVYSGYGDDFGNGIGEHNWEAALGNGTCYGVITSHFYIRSNSVNTAVIFVESVETYLMSPGRYLHSGFFILALSSIFSLRSTPVIVNWYLIRMFGCKACKVKKKRCLHWVNEHFFDERKEAGGHYGQALITHF